MFKPKKDNQLVQISSSSISSASSSLVSISSASMVSSTLSSSKAVSSESQVVSSTPTVQSSSKAVEVVNSKAKVESSDEQKNSLFLKNPDLVGIADVNNVPKFVQDYLNCPTKYSDKHFGNFVFFGSEKSYACPPPIADYSCKLNISYFDKRNPPSPYIIGDSRNLIKKSQEELEKLSKNGWICDIAYVLGLHYDGGESCLINSFNDNTKYVLEPVLSNHYGDCYAIPKSLLSEKDIELLKNRKNR